MCKMHRKCLSEHDRESQVKEDNTRRRQPRALLRAEELAMKVLVDDDDRGGRGDTVGTQ